MSASEVLKAARTAGIDVRLDGDDLLLQAEAPPPAPILDLLSRHKPEILALLRSGRDGWTGPDWRFFFANRVSVAEFKSGLPRNVAEARAFDCCVAEWLNRYPQYAAPERCFCCAQPETARDLLLPFGIGTRGQVWLHSRCSDAWYFTRMAQAVSALAAMGIAPPTEFPNDFGKNGAA
jgi:hypothetical protein